MFRRALPLAWLFIVATSASLTPQTASAQAPPLPSHGAGWVTFGAGGTDDGVNQGGAVVAGLSLQLGPLFATFTPMDLILSKGDIAPYRQDADGTCRDSQGRFAESERCQAVDVAYAVTADLAVQVPRTGVLLGAGLRGDRENNPWYGLVGFQRALSELGMWSLRLHVGPDYVSGIAALHIRFGTF